MIEGNVGLQESNAMMPYNGAVQQVDSEAKGKGFIARHAFLALGLVLVFGLFFVMGAILTTSFSFSVEGDAMQPTLTYGERVLVNRAVYWVGSPQRGDIVVFEAPNEPKDFIKRVIAVEGETVEVRADSSFTGDPQAECDGCGLYVNGVRLEEDYVLNMPDYRYVAMVVPEGHVFVLGDNRRNSSDSHVWGMLDANAIKGKAFFSLTDFGFLR
jgi:signal peptidase I